VHLRKPRLLMDDRNDALVPYSASSLRAKSQARSRVVNDGSSFRPFARENLLVPPFVWVSLTLIRTYQLWMPDSWKRECIYEPSCSQYAMICIERNGLVVGLKRTICRIRRCDGSRFSAVPIVPDKQRSKFDNVQLVGHSLAKVQRFDRIAPFGQRLRLRFCASESLQNRKDGPITFGCCVFVVHKQQSYAITTITSRRLT
jgi:putative component of membrane protein insertase Oxa1/YidC/SpoIIIJ protein YidD